MKLFNLRHAILLFLITLLVVAVLGCASKPETPEEAPVQQTVTEKPPEKAPEPKEPAVVEAPPEVKPEEPKGPAVAKPAPLTEAEISAARNAIARAEEADADYFAPDLIKAARQDLNGALRVRSSDPDQGRQLLAKVKSTADQAYHLSVEKNAQVLADRMERMKVKLIQINAPEFLPGEYRSAVAGIPKAEELYRAKRLAEARQTAYETLQEMSGLHDRLSERLRWVEVLKRDSGQYLNQAEKLQAHVRAPSEYERANQLFWQGLESFQKFQLVQSEDQLGRAREAALSAIQASRSRAVEEKKAVDDLMRQVMREIEAAAGLTVVTEDGTLIVPDPWSGEQYIQEEPAARPSPSSSMALPRDGETAVLGDVAEENLLDQAKQLWQLGVKERDEGNYPLAAEYFQEASRMVAVYKTQAVNEKTPIYVVRLIPERRDCLWRIAEYDFIYGNPYQWPMIWRRNRKLIQHPDLIYPGWKLAIPPQ